MVCRQALVVVLIVGGGVAQQRISLGGGRSELERQCLRLGQPATRGDAVAFLRRAGEPAVPLLLAAARRQDATSLPALRTLAAMGGVARVAAPGLRGLAEAGGELAAPAAQALAAIGERDSILVAEWQAGRVAELDPDGKVLRSVAMEHPWWVEPIAGDRVLVCRYNTKKVVEVGWDGVEGRSIDVPGGPIAARRLVDGTTIIASFEDERLFAVDAGGKEVWSFKQRARIFQVLDDDHVLVLDDQKNLVRELDLAGNVVAETPIPNGTMAFARGPRGWLCVGNDAGTAVLDADGKERWKCEFPAWAAQWLPDERLVVAGREAVALLDRDGKELWRHAAGQVGGLCARLAPVAR